MNRLRSEARLSRGRRHQLRGFRHIQVDQLSALIADRVIVTFHHPVVTAGAVAKINFVHEAGIFQVAERVVNGGITNAGQTFTGRLEDVAGSRVSVTLPDHLVDRIALGC